MNHAKYAGKCAPKVSYADGGAIELGVGDSIRRAAVEAMDSREQKGRSTATRPPREIEGPPTKVQAGWDRYVKSARTGGDMKKAAKDYEDSQK